MNTLNVSIIYYLGFFLEHSIQNYISNAYVCLKNTKTFFNLEPSPWRGLVLQAVWVWMAEAEGAQVQRLPGIHLDLSQHKEAGWGAAWRWSACLAGGSP